MTEEKNKTSCEEMVRMVRTFVNELGFNVSKVTIEYFEWNFPEVIMTIEKSKI